VSLWDEGLSDTTRNLAGIDHSPIRVLAGPGTGKTFALIRRMARLLEEGVNPRELFICTFTRTAARDLREEVLALGDEGVDLVRAGTLHSYCFRLLAHDEVLSLTGRVPRPLMAFEERFLLEDVSGGLVGGVRDCGKRLKAFNAAWARLQTDEPGWCDDPIDREFEERLESWLVFHKAMLIGELVTEALSYLRDNPAIEELGRYRHVLVDEYQDLNRAEQVLLDILASSGSLIVIGDEDQSIYSFKHAHPTGISTFAQTHAGTHDVSLQDCRRCPSLVVEMANSLIANNRSRTNRLLRPWPENPRGEVYLVQWTGMEEEAEGVAKFVNSRIDSGEVSAGQVLVLSPRRNFGYAIRDALRAVGAPAHSFFTEEALEGNPQRAEASQEMEAFTLLMLLANPEDRVALRCWCGFGSISLRSGAWARLRAYCVESGDSPRDGLQAMSSGSLQLPNCRDLVNRFNELESRLSQVEGRVGSNLTDVLFPDHQAWAEPIRSIPGVLSDEDLDAQSLLDNLRTGITQPEMPSDVDYVRVMSLHKSKGLTADLVIVVGCIEGALPRIDDDATAAEQQRQLEEQRRLLYVAVTRARRTLILSSITQLPRKLAHRIGIPLNRGRSASGRTIASRFLRELGPTRPQSILGTTLLSRAGTT